MIRFNQPHITGKELEYIRDVVAEGRLAGNGKYTKQCQAFFSNYLGAEKVLLTTSCTDALEMSGILLDIQPGDEVIMPSYTFVSTANAFVLRGAKIVFADSEPDYPNIDAERIEELITPRTKAIAVVHYAGAACDMDPIMALARKHDLFVVEDAAQAIYSYYKGKPLGSIGHLGSFSFHETKNIISGEGGLLSVNDPAYASRAEIIWEKGTNRSAFYRGEVDKYSWVDVGSSFLPSELIAAFLHGQLQHIEDIQQKRINAWQGYAERLQVLETRGHAKCMKYKPYHTNNGHLFYILAADLEERDAILAHMKSNGISAVFHYLTLHDSPFFNEKHDGRALEHARRYADTLIRLPLFPDLTADQQSYICDTLIKYFE